MKNSILQKISIKNILQSVIRRWEKLNGLDFLTTVKSIDLGLDPNKSYDSSPTDRNFIFKVLSKYEICNNDKILDIGCGKGNAMSIMLKFPFSQVDGIEISKQLVDIAMNNFKIKGIKNSTIYNIDASEFNMFDQYNYFYFFNPFNSSTMQIVLENLIESINSKPRKIILIYYHPVFHQDIINTKIFFKIQGYNFKNKSPMLVYSNQK
jgi:16S rRNA A1518/A1519 N6-dimethyltransferase RsmA/KsgA/DIM1 with predicted DNA glycosylase/AP lyase activity